LIIDGRLLNVSTENDGKTHLKKARNLQLCPLAPENDIFKSLPFLPKVKKIVS